MPLSCTQRVQYTTIMTTTTPPLPPHSHTDTTTTTIIILSSSNNNCHNSSNMTANSNNNCCSHNNTNCYTNCNCRRRHSHTRRAVPCCTCVRGIVCVTRPHAPEHSPFLQPPPPLSFDPHVFFCLTLINYFSIFTISLASEK